ncbi:MFS transporter [Catenulispora pinisilvae]|uniref:MFS transporter n=1 Tax=Catenulispora pinisilvae TaxID=2705253 RepID=UPI001892315A|nr:MFS transporter [Catenulispora pinisilvae]
MPAVSVRPDSHHSDLQHSDLHHPDSPIPALPQEPRPDKLGRDWHVLFTASAVSVLGDGAFVAALPLLAAGYTRDPRLISGLTVAGTLPWLVFSLQAGAIADRTESRRLSIRAQGWQLICVLAVGLLAMDRGAGWGLAALYVLAFALGMAAALAKSASQPLMTSVVPRDRLISANGQLYTAQSVAKDFVGPALGAALFALTPTLPFWADAVTFAASMLLIARLPRSGAPAVLPGAGRRSLRADVKEGLTWLAHHRLLRTTTMLSAAANFGSTMGAATLVLYVGTHHYGVLLSIAAIGGVIGGLMSRAAVARLGGRVVARVCSSVTPVAGIGIGLFGPNLFVVAGLLAVVSMSASLWNVAVVSQRQRLVPPHLLGRVSSAGIMVMWGMQPLGALAGGLIASGFGLAAPWVVGGSLRIVASVLAIRPLREWQD